MNELSVFDFKENPIRVQTIDNLPWFCLADCCRVLEISNSRSAVNQLATEGVVKTDTLTEGGNQQLNYINEPNLYRLIFRSNKPQAQAFADWVYAEVLPTLRQTGSYNLNQTPEEEIDDIALEYDAGNIQVAEFELRAIKVIAQLFGRDAAKQAYMSSKYLPKPIYAVDGKKDASAISCLEYLKTMFVSGYPLCKVVENQCVDMLKPAGLDLMDNMVCIATSSKDVAKHFANSRWSQNWIATLLELPHAERGRAAKRFAGITAKYIMVPTFYFRESTNVKN